jgi:sugar O-acyltransferase (sialic acid O-acetyltransferase NeuD family)
MLIAGAGGHAVEILTLLEEMNYKEEIAFFDNTDNYKVSTLFGKFKVIKTTEQAGIFFERCKSFCIGVGKPAARKKISEILLTVGGELTSVISPHAHIGKHDVLLQNGLNIMTGAVITNNVVIREGTLVHIHCSIHHETSIGSYCELSPGSRILGAAKIGNCCSIGTNAVIFPGVEVGDNAIIGAGAVVNTNIPIGSKFAGVPAKSID